MLKKSLFFDFLNRRANTDFSHFMATSSEDEQYINWNEFVLPHDYGDAETEYHAIRNSCAIFDVSPIRKIRVRGGNAGAFFDRLMTRPVSELPAMRATYAVFCNDDGSLKDDAILYKYADDDYLLMPSDVDHSPYFESLRQSLDIDNVSFTECTDAWAGVALQGPLSATAMRSMGFDGIEQLEPFNVRDYEIDGHTMRVSRMGFTADLGYECWFNAGLAGSFMHGIRTARSALSIALPDYGLSALQACRLEGGFIVAGWDCATEVDPQPGLERSPFELGLGWLVDLDAADFVGRDALRKQKEMGHPYTLRSFEIDQSGTPDDGATIYAGPGNTESAGIVTCTSWSWGMNKTIGNASIKSEHAELKQAWVEIGGECVEATLSRGPLLSLKRRSQMPAPLN